MTFQVSTKLASAPSVSEFLKTLQAGDLIITNEFVLAPHTAGQKLPCDVLYQEEFGKGEPSDEMIDAMLKAASGKNYTRIIGIGGGSVLDIAKLFVFGDGFTCEEIFERGQTLPKKRSLVAIPTTCGTGSEVTMISIARFEKKNTKKGVAAPALFPDEAVLIPALLLSQPYEVFASSSIDALIHASESFVSPKATAFSKAMGREAIERIIGGYKKLKENRKRQLPDTQGMGEFLTASSMAGIAFGNAGVGAVHALSYPVGAIYHVPHGKANYMFFAAVFFAYREKGADLAKLEEVLAHSLGTAAKSVWGELSALTDFILPRQTLTEVGANEADCAQMAASVIQNQQRLLVNNPVGLSEDDIKAIYLRCL